MGDIEYLTEMIKKSLYHGSYMIIDEPKVIKGQYTKDFGYAFYLTNIKGQAEKWSQKFEKSFISEYRLKDLNNLNIKIFRETDYEWMEFIVSCRADRNYEHNYDLIEGPMADDQIYDWVTDYQNGRLSKEEFIVLCKFRKPTHQIAICSERGLNKLEFVGGYRYA